MPSGKKILSVVIARGGSKGVPKKNLKPLGSAPLVSHIIRSSLQASKAEPFDVILSTDTEEIREAAIQYLPDRDAKRNAVSPFKAYDIRGRVPDEHNAELAGRIGYAFVATQHACTVLIGHGVRLKSRSSPRHWAGVWWKPAPTSSTLASAAWRRSTSASSTTTPTAASWSRQATTPRAGTA